MLKRRCILPVFLIILVLARAAAADADPRAPRDILASSRDLSYTDAARLLEQSLPRAGELTPWFLLELADRAATAGDFAKARSWSERQSLSKLPEPIADRVYYRLAESLIATGDRDRGVALVGERIKGGSAKNPLLWLLWFREAGASTSERGAVEAMCAKLDAANPNLKTADPDAFALSRYLSGLAAVRSGEWDFAARSLARFSPSYDAKFPAYAPWAAFYLGWSHYRLGRAADAIRELSRYLDAFKGHERGWQAATACALAATQSGADPLPFAERAVALAPSKPELAESLILKASVLTDRSLFDRAEAALAGVADGTATAGLTPSAARAAYLLGDLAFRQGKRDLAESRWLSLSDRFPKDPLAGDALFRAGEQRFIASEWPRAAELFARYRQEWPTGQFLDSALSLGGESYARAGKTNLAILWWEDYLKKYPTGSAAPRAWGNLVEAYRAEGDFAAASRAAESYLKAFPEEARLDGVPDSLETLRRLKSGESPDVASLVSAWEREGKASTATGRAAGLALARRYLADYGSRGNAKSVLSLIAARAPDSPDGLTAEDRRTYAASLALLGNALRDDGSPRDAARTLLKAGSYYAALDGERAAEALYGAADSFTQARLDGDAKKTVETLEKAWPLSAWTRRAELLLQSARPE